MIVPLIVPSRKQLFELVETRLGKTLVEQLPNVHYLLDDIERICTVAQNRFSRVAEELNEASERHDHDLAIVESLYAPLAITKSLVESTVCKPIKDVTSNDVQYQIGDLGRTRLLNVLRTTEAELAGLLIRDFTPTERTEQFLKRLAA
jgi:hypothetical protein